MSLYPLAIRVWRWTFILKTCLTVYAAHVQSYSSSHRLATKITGDFVSDNMLPTSLMRAVSKTSTYSLISHLPSSTLPSLSASLSTTSPASSLVQTEVDDKGIATVLANCVLLNKYSFILLKIGKAGQGPCQLPQPWTPWGETLNTHVKLFCSFILSTHVKVKLEI